MPKQLETINHNKNTLFYCITKNNEYYPIIRKVFANLVDRTIDRQFEREILTDDNKYADNWDKCLESSHTKTRFEQNIIKAGVHLGAQMKASVCKIQGTY
uniref:Uncharacterized protein n=1 Tax=Romanomermis culicivorax TaxID=13658 RepID=A0A915KAR2_ROMCU